MRHMMFMFLASSDACTRRRRLLVAVLAAMTSPSTSWAQTTPTSQQCSAGIDSLAAGARPGEHWQHLAGCGSAGVAALKGAIASATAETDTLYLMDLMYAAGAVRDTGLFRVTRALASDASASVAARLAGINLLVNQHRMGVDLIGRPGWQTSVSIPRSGNCVFSGESMQPLYQTTLPGDYAQQIAATLDTIGIIRPGENAVVRDFASCARRLLAGDVPLTVPASAITLTHVCGTTFSAANSSARPADLKARLAGTIDEWRIHVPANGTRQFFMSRAGTVELLQGTTVIATARNAGKGCP